MERRLLTLAALAITLVMSTPCSAPAQCPPEWREGTETSVPGVNGRVSAMASWDPDGPGPQPSLLVVAGEFTAAGSQATLNIAAWDGQGWSRLGAGLNGRVTTLAVYNGELIAGGVFISTGDGIPVVSIAKWDGNDWRALGAGIAQSTTSAVNSMTVFQGQLFVTGAFVNAGGVSVRNVAMWDGLAWRAVGDGIVGLGFALTVYQNRLIAAGSIDLAGGQDVRNIAAWDGSSWTALATGLAATVRCLTVYNNELIAGGDFAVQQGPFNHIARWNGTAWSGLGGAFATVKALTVHDGELIIGGSFTAVGPTVAYGVARWNGTTWRALSPGTTENAGIMALAVSNGQLFAGGGFQSMDSRPTLNVAGWNGALASSWSSLGGGFNALISNLSVFQGRLVASGNFTTAAGVPVNRFASWDGVAWQPLGLPNTSQFGNNLIGAFGEFNGQLLTSTSTNGPSGLARYVLSWNGTAWQTMGEGTSLDIFTFAVFRGELYIGGVFNRFGARTVRGVARWDGATWQQVGTGLSDSQGQVWVFSLAVYHDELIVGGQFTRAGGVPVVNIARWNGSTWNAMGAGVGVRDSLVSVRAMQTFDDWLVVGGNFTTAGAENAQNVAAWDGVAWHPMGEGLTGIVRDFTIHNNELVAAADFRTNDSPVARWDGTAWHGLGRARALNVPAIESFGGELIAGLQILSFEDSSSVRFGWARWGSPVPWFSAQPLSQTVCLHHNASYSVSVTGQAPFTFQWRRAGVPIDGSDSRIHVQHGVDGVSSTLLFTDVTAADDVPTASGFDCLVVNECGTVASQPAALVVCIADFNCTGSVTVQDVFDFLGAYFAGAASADINQSGGVDVQDVFDFIALFFIDCPR